MLARLKKQSYVTYIIISAIALLIIITFIYFVTKLCLTVNDYEKYKENTTIYGWVNAIGLAVLTVIPSVVGIVMMHRLRNRFDDIYKDYGCKI